MACERLKEQDIVRIVNDDRPRWGIDLARVTSQTGLQTHYRNNTRPLILQQGHRLGRCKFPSTMSDAGSISRSAGAFILRRVDSHLLGSSARAYHMRRRKVQLLQGDVGEKRSREDEGPVSARHRGCGDAAQCQGDDDGVLREERPKKRQCLPTIDARSQAIAMKLARRRSRPPCGRS